MKLRRFFSIFLAAAMSLVGSLVWSAPAPRVLDLKNPSVRAVIAVQDQVTPEVMTWPDVLGTAVGLGTSDDTAQVVNGMVDPSGAILEIGTISSSTVATNLIAPLHFIV